MALELDACFFEKVNCDNRPQAANEDEFEQTKKGR